MCTLLQLGRMHFLCHLFCQSFCYFDCERERGKLKCTEKGPLTELAQQRQQQQQKRVREYRKLMNKY